MNHLVLRHQQYFVSVMEQYLRVESSEKMKIARKQLGRNEKRIAELKRLQEYTAAQLRNSEAAQ